MLGNAGIYAGKKRRKPVQKPKKLPGSDGVIKSNPSKRHRDRLNGELERLTDLLPFPEEVRSRLDKLSVLRLSVGYLKVKSFFKATMKKNSVVFPGGNGLNMNGMDTAGFSEGEFLLQALNGFVTVIAGDGLVFYCSSTIQDYLGFHQSDVVHQSVFDLIHTDDRPLFRQQLHFALNPKPFAQEQGADVLPISSDTLTCDPKQLPPENSSFLERSFVCRFRCLLDNSSGFLAMKFQGRLKFLHGQSFMNEDGTHIKPQLALFSIATPVQAPSILEIRAKTLLFQTKHKLDFTPMGIDTRGKIVLGYSEIELCMRGSGYQFVHMADMMHCADNHLRMMKTGESGLTVFRLLTKANVWVWVQSCAKLIFKSGRPDFIIARQRALVNAEGEEHLRQRSLQLPFSFTTGEAVLYDSGISLDAAQFQPDGITPEIPKGQMDVEPKSLLGCILKQDAAVYTQNVSENQLAEDQVFMDSRALVNVASNSWQALGSSFNTDGSVLVKEEGVDTVVTMIDALRKMAHDGDLCAALQNLEVDATELMEWESALQKLSQDNIANNTKAELDSILTNDVFNYMENVLFKQSGEGNLNAGQTGCLGTVNNNQGERFTQVLQPSNAGLCEPQLFQRHSFDHTPVDGLRAWPQGPSGVPVSVAVQGAAQSSRVLLDGTSKLSHFSPQLPPIDVNIPSLQQLQLQDIFSPSIELPELSFPATSGHSGSVTFGSCGQAPLSHMGHQGMPGPKQANSLQQCPHNGIQAPMAAGGKLHSSVQRFNNEAPSVVDTLPSLIPCNGFSSPIKSSANNSPNPFPTACSQGSTSFQAQSNLQLQQWPDSQQQRLPPASITQNRHKLMPACHSQVSESPRLPPAGPWPQNINGLNHAQQGWLADGQHAPPSSCMFEKSLFPLPNGSHVDSTEPTPSVSSCQRRNDVPLDQSPPQGSCYFQWCGSEPVVGTSAITQENASISPQSHPLLHNRSSPEDILAMQRYLGCSEQKQIPTLPAENNTLFSMPPLVEGNMYFPDQTQTNICNF